MKQQPIYHVEIPVSDRHAAATWYAELFGWGYTHRDAMHYTTFTTGNIGGGFASHGFDENKKVLLYIGSDDVKSDLEKVKTAGGVVVADPITIPGTVEFAEFKDPTGNSITLMKDLAPGEGGKQGRPFVWVDIPADDRDKAGEWYSKMFGWTLDFMPEMDYLSFDDGGFGGSFAPVGDELAAGDVLIYISSDDIDRDLEKIKSAGGAVVMSTLEIPEIGWMGIFADLDGNQLALYRSMRKETQ